MVLEARRLVMTLEVVLPLGVEIHTPIVEAAGPLEAADATVVTITTMTTRHPARREGKITRTWSMAPSPYPP